MRRRHAHKSNATSKSRSRPTTVENGWNHVPLTATPSKRSMPPQSAAARRRIVDKCRRLSMEVLRSLEARSVPRRDDEAVHGYPRPRLNRPEEILQFVDLA